MAINTTGFTQAKTIYVDFDQDRKPSLRDIGSDQIGANGAKLISFGFGSESLAGYTVVLETKRVADGGLKYAIAETYTDNGSTRYKVALTEWFTTYRSALIMAVKVFNNNGVTVVDGEITTVDNDYLISVSDTFTLTVNYAPKATAVVPSFSASELELILATIAGKQDTANGIVVLQEEDALPNVSDGSKNGWTYLKKDDEGFFRVYQVNGSTLYPTDITVNRIRFDTTYTQLPSDIGEMVWSQEHRTYVIRVTDEVVIEVNQELVFDSKASETILNGFPIIFVEPQGDHALSKKATATDVLANPYGLRGIATETVNTNEYFKTTQLGRVDGVDTSAWAIENGGTILYFDIEETGTGAYNMTTVRPSKPNPVIKMGSIEKWSTGGANNGRIIVRIDYGESLHTLHDVDIDGAVTGDIIRKTNGVWHNVTDLTDLEARTMVVEIDITKIENGTTVVGESVYASKDKSERNLVDLVHKTRTILGIDLADDILLGEFKTALGNATQSVAGLMSETDKARLDALHALLNESESNDVVDAINEILAIFENYPEGVDLVTALAGKVDKEVGKGLSANDYSDTEKNKVSLSDTHRQATGNPHNTTFAQVLIKPTTISGYGITDAYTKEYIDSLKDMNGWESELITTTPLTNGGTVALSTLQAFDTIKLFARNTTTNEIDTDSFETSVGLTVGYEYRLFDNADIKFVIGTPNCTFTTSAGYELRIIGQKYTELKASDVSFNDTVLELGATNVQTAIEKTIAERTPSQIDTKIKDIGLNTPLDVFKGKTLKEIFEDNNLLLNPNFKDGSNNWVGSSGNSTISVTDNVATITIVNEGQGVLNSLTTQTIVGNKYHYLAVAEKKGDDVGIELAFGTSRSGEVVDKKTYHIEFTATSTAHTIGFRKSTFDLNSTQVYVYKTFAIDKTINDIEDLTDYDFEFWFNVYNEIKEKTTFQFMLENDAHLNKKINNKYAGKKVVFIGDSITEYNIRTAKNYHDYVADDLGIENINLGVSGSGFMKLKEENKAYYQRILNVVNNADLYVFVGSGNDLSLVDTVLGVETDNTDATICGCINLAIANLLTVNPLAKIMFASSTAWQSYGPSNSTVNSYTTKIKNIAFNNGIYFLDVMHESGLRPDILAFRNAYYSRDDGNGVHPDENGHKWFYPLYREAIKKMLSEI